MQIEQLASLTPFHITVLFQITGSYLGNKSACFHSIISLLNRQCSTNRKWAGQYQGSNEIHETAGLESYGQGQTGGVTGFREAYRREKQRKINQKELPFRMEEETGNEET